jgi:hypothetical protein
MYLITQSPYEPFIPQYYEYENHYVKGMIVYNLLNKKYTTDGINWINISFDHL